MSHSGKADNIISKLIPRNKFIRVLDLGTGYGKIGLLIRSINPNAYITGIEIYYPYYKLQKQIKIYDKMIFGNVINEITEISNQYDIAIGSHFIEHIKKKEGLRLLDYIENNFKPGLMIWTTPRGGSRSSIKNGNIHNKHKSAWNTRDFTEKGYSVDLAVPLINSRAVNTFADIWFRLNGKKWNRPVIIAHKRFKQ